MPEVVLATQNPGKIAELRSLLAPLGCTVLGLADVGDLPPEPEETEIYKRSHNSYAPGEQKKAGYNWSRVGHAGAASSSFS